VTNNTVLILAYPEYSDTILLYGERIKPGALVVESPEDVEELGKFMNEALYYIKLNELRR